MRTFTSVLCVAIVVALSVAALPFAHGHRIPEKLDNRLEEMIKWFEARIPIYQKANYLLKKLGVEVSKLSDLHNGIDFHYQGSSDLEYYGQQEEEQAPPLRIVKVTEDDLDMKPIDEVVRKALEKRNVKSILQLSPEIKNAFKKIMHKE